MVDIVFVKNDFRFEPKSKSACNGRNLNCRHEEVIYRSIMEKLTYFIQKKHHTSKTNGI